LIKDLAEEAHEKLAATLPPVAWLNADGSWVEVYGRICPDVNIDEVKRTLCPTQVKVL